MSYELLSAVHIASAVAAIVAGSLVVALTKGTLRHRTIGYIYVAAMAALNVSALSINRFTGSFGAFHFAALISAATLLAGFVPVFFRWPSGRWLEAHFQFMVWSYIGLLAGGAAEAAVRVPAAPFWPAVVASSLLICAGGAYLLARNNHRMVATYGTAGAQQGAPADAPRPAGSGFPRFARRR